ncbi:hypothetical protein JL722_6578 [Aureococcus anophagefferens]|nr:hypothetical protein JL722_6578 [Aureococcus anophagefferens]
MAPRSVATSPATMSALYYGAELINWPDEGKLATIIDIVDGNKCLVDGPATKTGVARQVILQARALTDIVVKIPKKRQKTLNKAWDGADVLAKWDASSWAKKLAAKKKRASSRTSSASSSWSRAAVRDRRRQGRDVPGADAAARFG